MKARVPPKLKKPCPTSGNFFNEDSPMSYCRFQHQNVTSYGLIENVRGDATITRTLEQSPEFFC